LCGAVLPEGIQFAEEWLLAIGAEVYGKALLNLENTVTPLE